MSPAVTRGLIVIRSLIPTTPLSLRMALSAARFRVSPVDFSGQGDPAVLDLDENGVDREGDRPGQDVCGTATALGVVVSDLELEPDLDSSATARTPFYPAGGALGGPFRA
jgi:hypothetical protein